MLSTWCSISFLIVSQWMVVDAELRWDGSTDHDTIRSFGRRNRLEMDLDKLCVQSDTAAGWADDPTVHSQCCSHRHVAVLLHAYQNKHNFAGMLASLNSRPSQHILQTEISPNRIYTITWSLSFSRIPNAISLHVSNTKQAIKIIATEQCKVLCFLHFSQGKYKSIQSYGVLSFIESSPGHAIALWKK